MATRSDPAARATSEGRRGLILRVWDSFAAESADSDDLRVEKRAAFVVAAPCCIAGAVWWAVYLAVFGWGLTAALPLLFVFVVGGALVVAHLRRDHRYAVYAQIVCIILIPVAIQWSIGGVFDSGLVIVWAFVGPITSLVFFSLRQSAAWLGLYLAALAITVGFNGTFAARAQPVGATTRLVFVGMNLGAASVVVFAFSAYFVTQAIAERRRANQLLLNVLPKQIASILKRDRHTIAENYQSASVLFADIVGSTPLFADLDPAEAVDWLNEVFSVFDALVEKHGLEKIRTIGDNYMVAAGVPVPRPDHAYAICDLGLDMLAALDGIPDRNGRRLEFRIGINSGPLVGGVIGTDKFHYDVWGDTVNTASRMESHGQAGKIHITQATRDLVRSEFECEPRGRTAIKGKGEMDTWFVISRIRPVRGP
jgi:adenylate cyclase